MEPRFDINWKWFWFGVGWYRGEEPVVFRFVIGEFQRSVIDDKIDFISFLSIQVAKFSFSFGWKGY